MEKRKSGRFKHILFGILGFTLIFVLVFFGVQFFTKTGIFRIPGVVYYDESLTAEEIAILDTIFTEEVDLDKDVTISAHYSFNWPFEPEGKFVIDELVPVTDFYSSLADIPRANLEEILTPELQEQMGYKLISVNDLDYTKKLVSIHGRYYLDDLMLGVINRVLVFESEKYAEEVEPLVAETFTKTFPTKKTTLTLAQTGVTALSRGMNVKMNEVGSGEYFAAEIGPFLSQFDYTHTSNESSFTSAAGNRDICSDPRFKDTLLSVGLDVVELTGNHNQDCGDTPAREAIDWYNENGIKIVGGGKTAAEAAVPLEIDDKNNHITMLAFNESTGGATYDDTPGANQYYEEVAREQIAAAKARGDLVIVDMQYYECAEYDYTSEVTYCEYAGSSAGDQIGVFRSLIDMGADVVVGTSAHQPQTFELYGNGVIYYGLGNLFFDQVWWPGTTRSLVLVHYIYNNKLLQTKIVPTVYDSDMQTRLMDEETAKWYLERLASERP